MALLIGCGLRRAELTALETKDFEIGEERWVIAELIGKGKAHPDGSGSGVRRPVNRTLLIREWLPSL
ncbi:MAG TPA: hypothetical protein VGK24_12100 [Candidatus Angelobacter sp.]